MYCKKCGTLLKDSDQFCAACGAKVEGNDSKQKDGYAFYEQFGPDAVQNVVNVAKAAFWLPSLISAADKKIYEKGFRSGETIIKSFIVTDRSLIFKGNEYPSDVLSVVVPKSKTEMKVSISGKEIHLLIEEKDFFRLFNAIIRLNGKNRLASKRQELLYAYSTTAFLKEAYAIIRKLPVTFNKNIKFENLYNYNELITVNKDASISKENEQLLQNYEYAQTVLNDFYKERQLFSEKYNFCKRVDNLKRIISNMEESDDDLESILRGLFSDEEANTAYNAEDESDYLDNDSNSASKHVLRNALAVGVTAGIAGKLVGKFNGGGTSSRKEVEAKDYYATYACQRTKLNGKSSCVGCTLASCCKRALDLGR